VSTLLVRGLILGFSIAAPVGPIGVLCIRRTLVEGRRAGLATGLGAATADALYGMVAALGLTVVAEFLVAQQMWLRWVGGAFLCYLGVRTLLAAAASCDVVAPEGLVRTGEMAGGRAYLSALGLTLTNPMTVLAFAAIFAGAGLAGAGGAPAGAAALVAGTFLGSAAWWVLLTTGVGVVLPRLARGEAQWAQALVWVNRVSGVVLVVFGVVALVAKGA
jgi:threonine/homoserine/homoserine lactone efflux protein